MDLKYSIQNVWLPRILGMGDVLSLIEKHNKMSMNLKLKDLEKKCVRLHLP